MALRKTVTIELFLPAIYACNIGLSFIILYVLHCQHIPCAGPFLGCNVSCCRLFRRRVRCLLGRGSILSDAVGVDGLTYLPSLPLLSYLDGLKPYLSYLFSLEIFDVISV